MGARVEGKKKKKSIKANVTSKFGSKRRLSRMGKKVQKGQMGKNTEFITRSSALKKLQITLKDFRRLCILKGIYPRVPSKGSKGNDKVYYDIKDISYIMHEPLLEKFRDFKSFMKKIRKAAGRNETSEARRRDELKPKMPLDHLVKERYPRFIDALRDLDDALCMVHHLNRADDALCMVHLFAGLPSMGRATSERTSLCSRLVREWQYYVSKSRSLHKVFVSVKGVYFQAEVLGEPITWLVPHQFTQVVPKEVDVRVMLTFLEFYEVFLQFVLFKLYAMQNLQYPPSVDAKLDAEGSFLLALKADRVGDEAVGAEDSAGPVAAITSAAAAATEAGKSNKGKVKGKGKEQLASLPKLLKDLSARADAADDTEGGGKSRGAEKAGDEEQEEEDGDDDKEELGKLAAPLGEALSKLQRSHSRGKERGRLTRQGEAEGDDDHYDDDNAEEEEEEVGELEQRTFDLSADPRQRLFSGLVFFISREVPLNWLQLCTISFGAKVGWEGHLSPFKVDDPRITHQVVDRPQQAQAQVQVVGTGTSTGAAVVAVTASREYVQPQWVFDCINAQMLLPVANYRPGNVLPPHLSPFVDDEKEGYLPRYREEVRKLQGKAITADAAEDVPTAATTTNIAVAAAKGAKKRAGTAGAKKTSGGKHSDRNEDDDDEEEEDSGEDDGDDDGSDDDDDDDDDDDEDQEEDVQQKRHMAVIEQAAAGKRGPKGVAINPAASASNALTEAEETAHMSQIMMSKKTKRLYGRMQHGIEKKQEANRALQQKRQKIEEQEQQQGQGQKQQQQKTKKNTGKGSISSKKTR